MHDLIAADPLVIDWSRIKFYNTVMAAAAGSILAILGSTMLALINHEKVRPRGWAIGLGVSGSIAFLTGAHMTLTWPLAPQYAADNISFGEPELVIGAIAVGLSFYFWRRADFIEAQIERVDQVIAGDLCSLNWLLYSIGAGMIGIGLAGPIFGLYTAPPEEPIVGLAAEWGFPWVFSFVFGAIYIATGVLALMTPSVLEHMAKPKSSATPRNLFVVKGIIAMGIVFLIIAAAVWFTHLGMVLNTTQ